MQRCKEHLLGIVACCLRPWLTCSAIASALMDRLRVHRASSLGEDEDVQLTASEARCRPTPSSAECPIAGPPASAMSFGSRADAGASLHGTELPFTASSMFLHYPTRP